MNTGFETEILNNGFTIKYIKNEHLHSTNIGIYARKLPEKVCGLAHMTEHMFFRRLSDIPQQQLYMQTDKMGATLNGTTYSDFIRLDITVSSARTKQALSLISKVFDDFDWLPAEIKSEKNVVKRQIEDRYDSVYSKADLNYYKGTPAGTFVMGKISDINKMSAREINMYRKKVFVPNNCCIVLTGNFSNSDLLFLKDKLSDINPNENEIRIPKYRIERFADRDITSDKIYNSDYDFSDISISFDIDEKLINRYAAEILYSILGFGVTSKLSQELRESLGITSEIGGSIDFSDYAGRMTFEFDTNNKNLMKSLYAAFGIISRKTEFTESDMQSSKVFYTDNQYRLLDDVKELNFLIGWRSYIENEKIISIDDLCEKYASITVDDLNNTAKILFDARNLIITVSNNNKYFSQKEILDLFKNIREEL